MVAYTKHKQRKKEESERLRGEGAQIESMDLRLDCRRYLFIQNPVIHSRLFFIATCRQI